MSPRSSAADAARNRSRIVDAAANQASAVGFSQVTVSDIARELDMSKSGVLGGFGSRSELLDDALATALAEFAAAVIAPSEAAAPGRDRLRAIATSWVSYLTDCPFPGGCVVTAASVDLDSRPGPLRDRLVREVRRWREFLVREFRAAGASNDAARDGAFALTGIAMAANQEVQLLADRSARARALRTMEAIIDSAVDPERPANP